MGQRFASLKEFFRMEGEKSAVTACPNVIQSISLDMVNQEGIENFPVNKNNGNPLVPNSQITLSRETKPDENLNERLNLNLDNHNTRFESLYSQPVEALDTKQVSFNGNTNNSEALFRPREVCCSSCGGSNSSSSSEDSPINLPLRRSSKTLSFGKRKSEYYFIDSPCSHYTIRYIIRR